MFLAFHLFFHILLKFIFRRQMSTLFLVIDNIRKSSWDINSTFIKIILTSSHIDYNIAIQLHRTQTNWREGRVILILLLFVFWLVLELMRFFGVNMNYIKQFVVMYKLLNIGCVLTLMQLHNEIVQFQELSNPSLIFSQSLLPNRYSIRTFEQ